MHLCVDSSLMKDDEYPTGKVSRYVLTFALKSLCLIVSRRTNGFGHVDGDIGSGQARQAPTHSIKEYSSKEAAQQQQ